MPGTAYDEALARLAAEGDPDAIAAIHQRELAARSANLESVRSIGAQRAAQGMKMSAAEADLRLPDISGPAAQQQDMQRAVADAGFLPQAGLQMVAPALAATHGVQRMISDATGTELASNDLQNATRNAEQMAGMAPGLPRVVGGVTAFAPAIASAPVGIPALALQAGAGGYGRARDMGAGVGGSAISGLGQAASVGTMAIPALMPLTRMAMPAVNAGMATGKVLAPTALRMGATALDTAGPQTFAMAVTSAAADTVAALTQEGDARAGLQQQADATLDPKNLAASSLEMGGIGALMAGGHGLPGALRNRVQVQADIPRIAQRATELQAQEALRARTIGDVTDPQARANGIAERLEGFPQRTGLMDFGQPTPVREVLGQRSADVGARQEADAELAAREAPGEAAEARIDPNVEVKVQQGQLVREHQKAAQEAAALGVRARQEQELRRLIAERGELDLDLLGRNRLSDYDTYGAEADRQSKAAYDAATRQSTSEQQAAVRAHAEAMSQRKSVEADALEYRKRLQANEAKQATLRKILQPQEPTNALPPDQPARPERSAPPPAEAGAPSDASRPAAAGVAAGDAGARAGVSELRLQGDGGPVPAGSSASAERAGAAGPGAVGGRPAGPAGVTPSREPATVLGGYLGNKVTMWTRAKDMAGKVGNAFAKPIDLLKGATQRIVEPFGGSGVHGAFFKRAMPGVPRTINDLSPIVHEIHRLAKENPAELTRQVNGIADAWGAKAEELYQMAQAGASHADIKAATADFLTSLKDTVGGEVAKHAIGKTVKDWSDGTHIAAVDNIRKAATSVQAHAAELAGDTITTKPTDAREMVAQAGKGDTLILDPPYIDTAGYAEGGDMSKDIAAAERFIREDIAAVLGRGAHVIYTNAPHPTLLKALREIGLHTDIVWVPTHGVRERTLHDPAHPDPSKNTLGARIGERPEVSAYSDPSRSYAPVAERGPGPVATGGIADAPRSVRADQLSPEQHAAAVGDARKLKGVTVEKDAEGNSVVRLKDVAKPIPLHPDTRPVTDLDPRAWLTSALSEATPAQIAGAVAEAMRARGLKPPHWATKKGITRQELIDAWNGAAGSKPGKAIQHAVMEDHRPDATVFINGKEVGFDAAIQLGEGYKGKGLQEETWHLGWHVLKDSEKADVLARLSPERRRLAEADANMAMEEGTKVLMRAWGNTVQRGAPATGWLATKMRAIRAGLAKLMPFLAPKIDRVQKLAEEFGEGRAFKRIQDAQAAPGKGSAEANAVRLDPAKEEARRRWFGNSKVVDAEGEPAVAYHGTTADTPFSVFDGASAERDLSHPNAAMGAHFAETPEAANAFAGAAPGKIPWLNQRERQAARAGGGRVYPVHLRIENPKRYRTEAELNEDMAQNFQSRMVDEHLDFLAEGGDGPTEIKSYADLEAVLKDMQQHDAAGDSEGPAAYKLAMEEIGQSFARHLKRQGHDGVQYANDIEGGGAWIAFDPAQIKSVNNRGSFDPKNENIAYSVTLKARRVQAEASDEQRTTWARQDAEANEILQDQGKLDELFRAARAGEPLSAAQDQALRVGTVDSLRNALGLITRKGLDPALADYSAFAYLHMLANRKAGQALRALQNVQETNLQKILGPLTTPRGEWARKLRQAGSKEKAEEILNEWKARNNLILDKLAERGIDLRDEGFQRDMDDMSADSVNLLRYEIDTEANNSMSWKGFLADLSAGRVVSDLTMRNLLWVGSAVSQAAGGAIYATRAGVRAGVESLSSGIKSLDPEVVAGFGGRAQAAQHILSSLMTGTKLAIESVRTGNSVAKPKLTGHGMGEENLETMEYHSFIQDLARLSGKSLGSEKAGENVGAATRVAVGPGLEAVRFIDELTWATTYDLTRRMLAAKRADGRDVGDIIQDADIIDEAKGHADRVTQRMRPDKGTVYGKMFGAVEVLRSPTAGGALARGPYRWLYNPLFHIMPIFRSVAILTGDAAKIAAAPVRGLQGGATLLTLRDPAKLAAYAEGKGISPEAARRALTNRFFDQMTDTALGAIGMAIVGLIDDDLLPAPRGGTEGRSETKVRDLAKPQGTFAGTSMARLSPAYESTQVFATARDMINGKTSADQAATGLGRAILERPLLGGVKALFNPQTDPSTGESLSTVQSVLRQMARQVGGIGSAHASTMRAMTEDTQRRAADPSEFMLPMGNKRIEAKGLTGEARSVPKGIITRGLFGSLPTGGANEVRLAKLLVKLNDAADAELNADRPAGARAKSGSGGWWPGMLNQDLESPEDRRFVERLPVEQQERLNELTGKAWFTALQPHMDRLEKLGDKDAAAALKAMKALRERAAKGAKMRIAAELR